jgi:hypothetical protein
MRPTGSRTPIQARTLRIPAQTSGYRARRRSRRAPTLRQTGRSRRGNPLVLMPERPARFAVQVRAKRPPRPRSKVAMPMMLNVEAEGLNLDRRACRQIHSHAAATARMAKIVIQPCACASQANIVPVPPSMTAGRASGATQAAPQATAAQAQPSATRAGPAVLARAGVMNWSNITSAATLASSGAESISQRSAPGRRRGSARAHYEALPGAG